MITITHISQIRAAQFDEIWAIMRFPKKLPKGVSHVPQLSPSKELWQLYMSERDAGRWNKETFETVYVPKFLLEMLSTEAKEKLKELLAKASAGKRICLYCVCPDESLCHRAVIGGLLQWMARGLHLDIEIKGLQMDYSQYGQQYAATAAPSITIPGIRGKQPHTMCFTGVRPNKLCGYKREPYKPFIRQLTILLKEYYKIGIRFFVTGGAQGFDQLAFWAIHGLKQEYGDIHNVVYVPFAGQESIWPKQGVFSQADYSQMLSHADDIVLLRNEKPVTKRDIISALYSRNEAMVNHTDLVLALQNDWNWKDSDNGGTAHCMQYALTQRRPIHRLSYTTGSELVLTQCSDALDD